MCACSAALQETVLTLPCHPLPLPRTIARPSTTMAAAPTENSKYAHALSTTAQATLACQWFRVWSAPPPTHTNEPRDRSSRVTSSNVRAESRTTIPDTPSRPGDVHFTTVDKHHKSSLTAAPVAPTHARAPVTLHPCQSSMLATLPRPALRAPTPVQNNISKSAIRVHTRTPTHKHTQTHTHTQQTHAPAAFTAPAAYACHAAAAGASEAKVHAAHSPPRSTARRRAARNSAAPIAGPRWYMRCTGKSPERQNSELVRRRRPPPPTRTPRTRYRHPRTSRSAPSRAVCVTTQC